MVRPCDQMRQESLTRYHLWLHTKQSKTQVDQRPRGVITLPDIVWSRPSVESTELPEIAVECEVFRALLGLLPRQLPREEKRV